MTASRSVRVQHGREYEQLLTEWICAPTRFSGHAAEEPIGELYQLLVQRGQHQVIAAPPRPPRESR